MRKIITIMIVLTALFAEARPVLKYEGNNIKIADAVICANRVIQTRDFYSRIRLYVTFDNSAMSGEWVANEILSCNDTILVTEYCKKMTKCNAKTQTEICINTAKLDRDNASITNTVIHELVHYVDWDLNHRWDYTHDGQGTEDPPVSAPYVIGEIAEKMTLETTTTKK